MKYIKCVEVDLASSVYLKRQVTKNRSLNLLHSPQDIKTCFIRTNSLLKSSSFSIFQDARWSIKSVVILFIIFPVQVIHLYQIKPFDSTILAALMRQICKQ
jgi:hypothetical protein